MSYSYVRDITALIALVLQGQQLVNLNVHDDSTFSSDLFTIKPVFLPILMCHGSSSFLKCALFFTIFFVGLNVDKFHVRNFLLTRFTQ